MTAQLCQLYTSSATSTAVASESSTAWAFTLPNACGAHNRLILACAYSTTTAPTITDNNGNTWPAGSVTSTSGSMDLTIWDLKNANAGTTKVTITFGAAQQPVYFECSEWSGLSQTVANGGTTHNDNITTDPLTCGSFTPTNNNGNGGNLILAYFYDAFGDGHAGPTTYVPMASPAFTLMQANVISNSTSHQCEPCASEFFVQATSAAINVSMTKTADTTTNYNCAAIAIPLDSAGGTAPSASAIRIVKSIKNMTNQQASAATIPLQFPTTGNLRVFITSVSHNSATAGNISSVTDSESNTWTDISQSNDSPAVYYFKGAAANPNLVVTLHVNTVSAGQNMDGWFLDIANAATGTVVGATGHKGATGTGGSLGTPISVPDQPDITPTSTSSLIVTCFSNGNGPTTGPTSPAGGITNNIVFANISDENDGGTVNSGDAFGYKYNTSTSAQNWTWTSANGATTVNSVAIEFLQAAAAGAQTPYQTYFAQMLAA